MIVRPSFAQGKNVGYFFKFYQGKSTPSNASIQQIE